MTTTRPTARRAGGYTLVELFVTVAVLMMVLGLAVNLATRQRDDLLKRRVRGQMRELAAAVAAYAAAHGGQPPDVAPLVDPAVAAPDEPALAAAAARNRDDVRRALGLPPPPSPAADPLTDPWGQPIVLMPRQSPLIGMAAGDRFFLVSGGPDRRYLTRADNLYSYDDPGTDPADRPADPPAATRPTAAPAGPAGGGHRE